MCLWGSAQSLWTCRPRGSLRSARSCSSSHGHLKLAKTKIRHHRRPEVPRKSNILEHKSVLVSINSPCQWNICDLSPLELFNANIWQIAVNNCTNTWSKESLLLLRWVKFNCVLVLKWLAAVCICGFFQPVDGWDNFVLHLFVQILVDVHNVIGCCFILHSDGGFHFLCIW